MRPGDRETLARAAATSPPDRLVLTVDLRRGENVESAALALAHEGALPLCAADRSSVLHPREAAYFDALPASRRRQDFLLGRLVAKTALRLLRPSLDPPEIEIRPGVFQQPVLLHAGDPPLAVCFTHSGALAAALAFPAGHPLGLDLERIEAGHTEAMRAHIAEDELPPADRAMSEAERYTRVWTVKEAISKILRCGLMTPLALFRLSERQFSEDGRFTGAFVNFRQYRFLSLVTADYALALVHPARTTPVFAAERVLRFIAACRAPEPADGRL